MKTKKIVQAPKSIVSEVTCDICGKVMPVDQYGCYEGGEVTLDFEYGSKHDMTEQPRVVDVCDSCADELFKKLKR